MSKTVIEKILSAHSAADAQAGATVWIDLDVRSARDFGGANVVGNYRREFGAEPVADPERTFFTFDCVVPAKTIAYANNQHTCRLFAREQGVRVFDVDAGIGTHVLMEEGLARPGGTAVGTDSHMNVLGAIGCFGQGMGDTDIAFAFRTGRTWFEVPGTIRVVFEGQPGPDATARDLTLALVGRLGSSGALGRCVEVYGPAVEALDLPGRITLSSMATETGAIALFVPPDEAVLAWCGRRAGGAPVEAVYADPDARYEQTIAIDVDGLQPLVSRPGSPADVVPLREVAGERIDTVFIGSCTNGRFEDLAAVADLVRGRRVAPGVTARAVPATREVYARMLETGVLADLFSAGFVVVNAGCGGCASGQVGMTGKGEVQVSTSNRNFKGKQGDGPTYLASPATAARAALAGVLALPEAG